MRRKRVTNEALISEKSPFFQKEAYVRLRTNFIYSTMNGQYQSVLFTSCESGEGKSAMVLNLAYSLAVNNKKVIVLDCDLRKSKMARYLTANWGDELGESIKNHPGLSAILSGMTGASDCILHCPAGFDVIVSGMQVPNPSELLGSERMQTLLEDLEEQYDYVLLDAPPILSVSDPAILSTVCDGVIFVVKHESVKRKQVLTAIQSLQAVDGRILGTVLSQYEAKKDHSNYGKSYLYEKKYMLREEC